MKLIQAGKPTQNACIELFHSKFRDEYLNEYWFTTLAHALAVIAAWRQDYNEQRPHSALNYLSPSEFAVKHRVTADAPAAVQELVQRDFARSPLAPIEGGESLRPRFERTQWHLLRRHRISRMQIHPAPHLVRQWLKARGLSAVEIQFHSVPQAQHDRLSGQALLDLPQVWFQNRTPPDLAVVSRRSRHA
ncbi:transposase [Pandoraea fibrosis]|uniref:Transposase n=1 Tax=Pandoraea fibrosis TaxID=1891094 RepID=A0A5E4W9S8_9BURK|nr:transposase [Pandoraea fibrosis]